MKLRDYMPEIFAIAVANNVDFDVAMDMFLNNIQDAGKKDDQYFYEGAKYFNYLELQPRLEELKDTKQDFVDHVKAYLSRKA